jgi:uncharacterized membrane protein
MTLPAFTMSTTAVSRKRLAFLCIAIMTAGLVVSFGWAEHRGLFAVSDTTTQAYTELYFTKSSDIPTRLVAGQHYAVPFAIVNHQGASKTYTYQMTLTQGGRVLTLPAQTAQLTDGQRVVHIAQFTPDSPVTETSVRIQLLGTQQSISFKVTP